MNNKSDCHPENPESGQQTNRQANLDTSERGTLVPPHPQNGTKNTEMPSNQPKVDNCHHWENPRICATCALLEPFHEHDGVMYHTCPHAPAEYACITDPHQPACTHYTPKQTD